MEPVKRSREISPQNAAFRQSGQHRVSCRLIRSSTPAPLRGPLRPGGKHVTGFSGRFPPLQIQFLCHLKGRKTLRDFLPASLIILNEVKNPREVLIKSLSDFILVFLFNARNKPTRIASYLRRLMTQHWIKIHMKFDSAN